MARAQKVQTTQQTGKFWKLLTLIAMGLILWGMFTWSNTSPQASAESFLKIFGGLLLAVFARIGGWWFHG